MDSVKLSNPSSDHDRLVSLINSVSDAVLAVDTDGIIQLCNGAALDIFDKNTLAGKNIDEVIDLIDTNGKQVKASSVLKKQLASSNRDLRVRYKDGSTINVEMTISKVRPSFGSVGAGYVVLARDITQAISIEQEREEFISVASHELRTPIAIAEGNLGNALVLAQKTGVSESVINALSASHEQVLFLGYLINDLSMLSRAEGKQRFSEIKTISIKRLLQDLKQNYEDRATEKNLILTETDNTDGAEFKSNDLYIREILQNFITNAIKYSEKGSVDLVADRQGDQIVFSVHDNGIGISTGDQQKLFSKFFRSEDDRVRGVSGTGLGLYICAKLAKLVEGKITVDSSLNAGSTFKLALPFKQS